jgi:hypothetical protein
VEETDGLEGLSESHIICENSAITEFPTIFAINHPLDSYELVFLERGGGTGAV